MAEYADKILNGAKAGDMPIQIATKYEMVANVKAGKGDRTNGVSDAARPRRRGH